MSNEPSVSEIQITPINPLNGLVAFASCVINNQFYLGSLGIYTSPSSSLGYRVTYPTKALHNGTKINIVYPLTKEVGAVMESRIVRKYRKLMEELTKGTIADDSERKHA